MFNNICSEAQNAEVAMEKSVWDCSQERVKAMLDEMPKAHRNRFEQLSRDEFDSLVKALGLIRAQYQTEVGVSHQSRLAGRYEKIFKVLIRVVSLRLLGVPRESLIFQVSSVLGEKVPEADLRHFRSGDEVGSYEETFAQSMTSTG